MNSTVDILSDRNPDIYLLLARIVVHFPNKSFSGFFRTNIRPLCCPLAGPYLPLAPEPLSLPTPPTTPPKCASASPFSGTATIKGAASRRRARRNQEHTMNAMRQFLKIILRRRSAQIAVGRSMRMPPGICGGRRRRRRGGGRMLWCRSGGVGSRR
ncbi:hypothetical protein K402DRAFT_98629 [Aulographum hederae CBS 113979]|uniref:Uncharacterized protein n=1 Tax=Aulographum hederae CBS 113979 TaxID=1176131 RepID=A0A6G1GYN2_9PEZI|nr:hypothetical protein K402DRAFT_98629 [Aulographum hederae CBS 113979]